MCGHYFHQWFLDASRFRRSVQYTVLTLSQFCCKIDGSGLVSEGLREQTFKCATCSPDCSVGNRKEGCGEHSQNGDFGNNFLQSITVTTSTHQHRRSATWKHTLKWKSSVVWPTCEAAFNLWISHALFSSQHALNQSTCTNQLIEHKKEKKGTDTG
jgi:hypothetical protein